MGQYIRDCTYRKVNEVAWSKWSCEKKVKLPKEKKLPKVNEVAQSKWSCPKKMKLPKVSEVAQSKWSCPK